jgi:hypothetical protein
MKRLKTSDPEQSPFDSSAKFGSPQTFLVQQEHISIASEAEVCYASINQDFSYQLPTRRPDIHAVTTSTIHVALSVAFDAVRYPRITHRKESSIG